MAKRKKKRRAWTAGVVRELVDGVKENDGVSNCQETEENRRRNAPWLSIGLSLDSFLTNQLLASVRRPDHILIRPMYPD